MPERRVRGKEVEWSISGIAHGQRRTMRVSPEVRTFLQSAVRAWQDAGDTVLLEPGFAKTLGLDHDLELHVANPLTLLRARDILRFVLAVLPALALLPLAWFLTRLSRDPEWPYVRAALRDPGSMVPLAEAHALLQPTAAMERTAPTASERFRLAYSRAMADAARARVGAPVAGSTTSVHLLVGLAHVRDLEALLGTDIALPEAAAGR